jgi:hypothetical protein
MIPASEPPRNCRRRLHPDVTAAIALELGTVAFTRAAGAMGAGTIATFGLVTSAVTANEYVHLDRRQSSSVIGNS